MHFSNREEINEKSQKALMNIANIEYKICFEDWCKCWHKLPTIFLCSIELKRRMRYEIMEKSQEALMNVELRYASRIESSTGTNLVQSMGFI